jgi:hypothetical protein
VRSSAAGILRKISQREEHKWKRQHGQWLPKPVIHYPYSEIALDQLVTGSLIEENAVALISIRDAIRNLIDTDPSDILKRLYEANLKLQRDLMNSLAEFCGIRSINGDKHEEDLNENLWNHAESLTSYSREVLTSLVDNDSFKFQSLFQNFVHIFNAIPSDDRQEQLIALRHNLEVSAIRLRRNVEVYSYALMRHPEEKNYIQFDHKGVFLVGANLAKAELQGVDLTEAYLQNANLSEVQLQDAILYKAELDGANLAGSNLQNAQLIEAKLNRADLSKTQLLEAHLSNTQLQEANLFSAHLQGAFLSGAQLQGAKLLQAE